MARINRVLDHIETHLTEPLPLRELAKVAAFSPYHFHRIFSALVGETVNQLVNRRRLARASTQLVYSPDKAITDIALDCGFSSPSTFARAFKTSRGCSASQWREEALSKLHEEGGGEEPRERALRVSPATIDRDGTMRWRLHIPSGARRGQAEASPTSRGPKHGAESQDGFLDSSLEIVTLDSMDVVYLRHTGPYAGDERLFEELWGRLMAWVGPRGLFVPGKTECLALYHDDPETTEQEKLRLSLCITAPADTEVGGEIGKMRVDAGRYAMARFELLPHEYKLAWESVYGGWLPQSGFQPDDRPTFEWFRNNPREHPEGRHVVDVCVPVKPL